MSQVMKRNAENAFEAENSAALPKKRRRRGHGGASAATSQEAGIKATPTKTATDSAAQVKTKKLEDRVLAPSSNSMTEIDTTSFVKSSLENRPSASKSTEHIDVEKQGSKHVKHIQREKREERSKKKRHTHQSLWDFSTTSNGLFIDHDPILTTNGEYLILPTKDTVQIYSTKTSLLVRSIHVKEKGIIASCCIASKNTDLVIATKRGAVIKYDLETGNKIGGWDTGLTIKSIALVGQSDTLLVTAFIEGQGDLLSALALQAGKKIDSTILLQDRRFQTSAVISSDGSTIVVCETNTVHIARANSDKYIWHQLRVPGTVCSFDVRTVASKKNLSVNIVVGLQNGSIHLYENVLQKLKADGDVRSRRLHWHRTQVRSVKWSRDGNYVVSGGDETVLVIWQLETNQQQFLPHLSTAILNITVSSSGAQYAVRLADNSVMILDTADLSPSSNVAGFCAPPRNEKTLMQLHPTHSNRLLAAVSIRASGKENAATHLQTYDIDTNLQLSKQALTRNVTTVVNVSPDGLPVIEPSVTHLQISHDGSWMATVDRWLPHASDMQALYLKDGSKQEYTETVLRFWRNQDNDWEVSARIDQAHQIGTVSIIGLAANPAISEFATMGEDGCVKIWRPKRRTRDGIQVRDKNGQPLFNWACVQTIQIEKPDSVTGVLAYSEDGSILAASWSRQQRHVHLIDPAGTLCSSVPDLLSEGSASVAMMGRHLICLANNLQIFDMITSQVVLAMEVDRNQSQFLAVNTRARLFAIGLNAREKVAATISMFDINNMEGAVADVTLPAHIRAIMASSGGFIVVDSDCRIRKLMPPGGKVSLLDSVEGEANKSLEDVFGRESGGAQKLIEAVDGPQDLLELFAVSTSSQPGVNELFNRISKAFVSVEAGA